ncbi:MAG: hypothetical protein KDH94_03520, partial [Coxiellaceae bacterium]|nr:hypothetical protein [Coxiellaceae bacterium]
MERGLRQLAEQRLAEEKAKSNFLEQRVNEFESAQNLQAASNKINATSSPAAGGLFTRAKTINESGPETPTPDSHAAPAA